MNNNQNKIHAEGAGPNSNEIQDEKDDDNMNIFVGEKIAQSPAIVQSD